MEKDPSIYGLTCPMDTSPMERCLQGAKAVVTYNSTSAVDAIVQGIPAITMDKGSISYPVSQHTLADIKALEYPDRTQWLNGLGYAQWTMVEMSKGLPWAHLNA